MSTYSNSKHLAIWMMAVLLSASGAWRLVAAQSGQKSTANTLYQQALHEQDATGNLRKAIGLYEQVLNAKPDRALAAKALLGMAECYQKLGDGESRRLYEQIVREYADQTDVVRTARNRLGTETRPGLIARQVAAVDVGGAGYGSISPDGRYFPYTNWESGDIYLRDLVTGGDLRVMNQRGE
jgi:tetratricopeptide (TPR) repeat protein